MSFNELETQKIKNVIEAELMAKRRPPMEIRSQVDLNYRLEKQSVIIFETRQHWADSNQQIESEIAKITYVKSRMLWKLFWMRQDLKWHKYEPFSEDRSLEKVLNTVMQDELGCFFG